MSLILMRHGDPDWPLIGSLNWPGLANDLAPLTELGQQQAAEAAKQLAAHDVQLVLSSPMTRALQTAAIVSAALDVPMRVELDLREWLPDETYRWTTADEVFAAYADMLAHDGERPPDHPLQWEPLPAVRERASQVVRPYVGGDRSVVAICHEVVIHALTGEQHTEHAGRRTVDELS